MLREETQGVRPGEFLLRERLKGGKVYVMKIQRKCKIHIDTPDRSMLV